MKAKRMSVALPEIVMNDVDSDKSIPDTAPRKSTVFWWQQVTFLLSGEE